MRILAIGECMAELAPLAEPGTFRLGFAGDTFNTAWYLARLVPDFAVSYFTAVGEDAISTQMVDMIRDSGIGTSRVQIVPDRSVGLYLISLDEGERSFSYWRGQSAARLLARDREALDQAMTGADLIYVSGITLAILDVEGRRTVLDALEGARQAGKRVAFDPNLRSHLWTTPKEMTDTVMQAAALCDIALPSFEDEAQWFGDADPDATLNRYDSAGATTVVVKNGKDQVKYSHAGEMGRVDVAPVTSVVDTTAAGDSFNAAILAGIALDKSLSDSVALACRLAGRVVQGKGALVPIDLELFEHFQ